MQRDHARTRMATVTRSALLAADKKASLPCFWCHHLRYNVCPIRIVGFFKSVLEIWWAQLDLFNLAKFQVYPHRVSWRCPNTICGSSAHYMELGVERRWCWWHGHTARTAHQPESQLSLQTCSSPALPRLRGQSCRRHCISHFSCSKQPGITKSSRASF
jgi:hypothetical protein